MPNTVGAALREWGQPYGLTEWEQEAVHNSGNIERYVWKVRSRFGSLSVRFTELLTKRGLEPRLIEELEKHLVGRYARKGHWNVNVLTTGQAVAISFYEEVSLDLVTDPIEKAWLR